MTEEKIEQLKEAHKHCSNHVDEILVSGTVGCFYCLRILAPREIKEWIDDGKTALCPGCGIDSLIGSSAGYIIRKEFLQDMHWYWFEDMGEAMGPELRKWGKN